MTLRSLLRWPVAIGCVALGIWLLWEVADSASFRDCIHTRKDYQTYHSLYDASRLIVAVVTARLKLHMACGFVSAGENEGAITALSGMAVAVFTFTLWRATHRLWHSSENQLTEFRRSLEQSERIAEEEFVATHAPNIRVKHVWLAGTVWDGEQIVIRIVVVNVGKTLAQVTGGQLVTLVRETDHELPIWPEMPPALSFHTDPSPHVLDSGISLEFPPLSTGMTLARDENVALWEGKKRLYCIGHIDYTDRHGRLRKTAYCRVLAKPRTPKSHLDPGRFIVHPDPDYEYED